MVREWDPSDGAQLALDGMPQPLSMRDKARMSLAQRFGVPPFSILDARAGYWQQRKAAWLGLGIKSEVGRSADLLGKGLASQYEGGMADAILKGEARVRNGAYGATVREAEDGTLVYETGVGATSIFDPVLAECCVRWWTPEGGHVLDPFAGGSVRGLVASIVGRRYTGIDLRPEQVAANEQQRSDILSGPEASRVQWVVGDCLEVLAEQRLNVGTATPYDGVFTCPPYYDLEQYSDDPHDLSNYSDEDFDEALDLVAQHTYSLCRPESFSVWVVGDVRDKRTGAYRGLPAAVVRAHEQAGWHYYNQVVLITATGSLAVRTGRIFQASRKVGNGHQYVLVFLKGDHKRIKDRFGQVEMGYGYEGDEDG